MTNTETFDDDYEEFDEFDDNGEERGLSGLVVLMMGIVMLGAFASVVYIAYQQGIRKGVSETPYVSADPEPIKIESRVADAEDYADREVYDSMNGETGPVEVLADSGEDPVDRVIDDPIGALASEAEDARSDAEEAIEDRLASLEQEDTAALDDPVEDEPAQAVTTPTPVADTRPTVRSSSGGSAMAGTHLVQIGALRSQDEADGVYSRLETKMGDFLDGKSSNVERADLGAKGIYFRLRIGPFTDKSDAVTFCEGLKERGQDCLVKAK